MKIITEIYKLENARDPEGWDVYGIAFRENREGGDSAHYVRVPPDGTLDKDGELCYLSDMASTNGTPD